MAKDDKQTPKQVSRKDQAKAAEKAEKDAAKNYEYKPVTAQAVAGEVGAVQGDNEKEKAREAGVTSVQYVDYEEALKNYESRDDVEPLAERRAREAGTTFEATSFRRKIGGVDHAGVATTDAAEVSTDEVNEGPTGK